MHYRIISLRNQKKEVIAGCLTLSEAIRMIEELHQLDKCYYNRIVSPIITLRSSTQLPAYVVDFGDEFIQYQVDYDHFSELPKITKN